MRTTLDLSENLIIELTRLSGIFNKTKAIELAISDFVRKLKREKIKNSCGKLNLKGDILKLRESELNE
jgi:hypothetical protein